MQLRDYVCKTLQLVEDQTHLLKSRRVDASHFAAAGLVRCCALLRGVCVLEDADLHALTGILERQVWESWLVSQYVLLRGTEALGHVQSDFFKRIDALQPGSGLGSMHVSEWEGTPKKLIIDQLATKLTPLLVDAGDTVGADLARDYDYFYRGHSQFSVHAGLSTFGLYSRSEREWASVEPTPPAPHPYVGSTSLRCTLHLAERVFERFEISTNELESIRAGIVANAKELFP